MAKFVNDTVLDQALDYVANNGTKLFVNNAEPASYAAASSTASNMLATHDLTSADFTLAAGDTNGRKVTLAQQADITVTRGGIASHITIASSAGSTRLVITTCTTQTLTSGNTVTVPAFDFEISDPVTS